MTWLSWVGSARRIGAATLFAVQCLSTALPQFSGPASGTWPGTSFVSVDLWQRPTIDLYARAIALPGWGWRLSHPDDTVMRTAFAARRVDLADLRQPRPWETDLNPGAQQQNGAAAAWLRWDGSERYAALVAQRRGNGAGDYTLLGADFSLPLGGTDAKVRGEMVSVAWARSGLDGTPHDSPALGDYRLRLAFSQQLGAVESSVAFEELSGSPRNDLGIATRAGARRLESTTNLVSHNLGPISRLGLYVLVTGTRTLDDWSACTMRCAPVCRSSGGAACD